MTLPCDYFRLISGLQRGLLADLLRGGLRGLSVPYGAVTMVRNRAYDLHLLGIQQVGTPVVSLGNLTTGGTGKTPVAAYLANSLIEAGLTPAIVSRGYRADVSGKNDEALVLEQLTPGAFQFRNRDRVAGAKQALREGAQVVLLDDGYQHRRLHRDFNLLLIDALNPWGYGHLLPRGLLRESLSGVQRADLVLITRTDLTSPQDRLQIRKTLVKYGCHAAVCELEFEPIGWVNAVGETRPKEDLTGKKPLAFCGIGNPQGFWETLSTLTDPLPNEARIRFPDHYQYSTGDLERIVATASDRGSDLLLTTLKDLVKIRRSDLGGIPLWGLQIGVRFRSGQEFWDEMIVSIKSRVPGSAEK